jgi:hypothetical protein
MENGSNGLGTMVPGHLALKGTDLELGHNIQGDDLILRVNKAGVLVFRARDAAPVMLESRLVRFNGFAPDVVFSVGDTEEELRRMVLAAGKMDDTPSPQRGLLAWLGRAS